MTFATYPHECSAESTTSGAWCSYGRKLIRSSVAIGRGFKEDALSEVIRILEKLFREWESPRRAAYLEISSDMRFRCIAKPPCPAMVPNGFVPPPELMSLWSVCCGGRLFEDTTYGQWGLELLSPAEALRETESYRVEREERDDPAISGDLIIGCFIADLEQLLLRCDPNAPDYGRIMIVAEIDPRAEWWIAASSLTEFLTRYAEAEGRKYWEPS
jgi:hypothetical protein